MFYGRVVRWNEPGETRFLVIDDQWLYYFPGTTLGVLDGFTFIIEALEKKE